MSCGNCTRCHPLDAQQPRDFTVALAGNPNVGKSTIFNGLTGLRQHTGNWAGKTVALARGTYCHGIHTFHLVDLPGTYSLLANSPDEEVTRDFLCFQKPDVTLVVADGTCLERNLNLVLQVIELTPRVVLAVNLLDEARSKGIAIDLARLSEALGVPVVGAAARQGEGLAAIKDALYRVAAGLIKPTPKTFPYPPAVEKALARLIPLVREAVGEGWNARWLALRLLDGDLAILERIREACPDSTESQQREVALWSGLAH